ncbi:peptidylprolyl isomerase [bacterium]|nr:peptidylprolyl isomerase [bacterium]
MSCLLEVNDIKISVIDAIRSSIMNSKDFLESTVNDLLIKSYCQKHQIIVSDQELQVAANELRYELSLESLEDLKTWLSDRFMTFFSFQEGLHLQILKNKIFHSFSKEEIKLYFLEHKLEFETVELYNIPLNDKHIALELHSQITEEDYSFHLAAMEYSTDVETKHLGGYAGFFSRRNLTGEIEAEVFKAQCNDIIGPITLGDQHLLFKVHSVQTPILEEQSDLIRQRLYDLVLERVSSKSSVHYHIFDE